MPADYYSVLGVARSASVAEIRKHFHRLARQHHPDRFTDDRKAKAEVEFQTITQAFNVLSDAGRRQDYDRQLLEAASGGSIDETAKRVNAYLQRGTKAYRANRFAEAADSFQRATEIDPTSARVWYHLALAAARLPDRLSLAMSAIQKACEIDQTQSSYSKLAGKLFTRGGLKSRAARFYNQALEWGGPDVEIERALAALEKQ